MARSQRWDEAPLYFLVQIEAVRHRNVHLTNRLVESMLYSKLRALFPVTYDKPHDFHVPDANICDWTT